MNKRIKKTVEKGEVFILNGSEYLNGEQRLNGQKAALKRIHTQYLFDPQTAERMKRGERKMFLITFSLGQEITKEEIKERLQRIFSQTMLEKCIVVYGVNKRGHYHIHVLTEEKVVAINPEWNKRISIASINRFQAGEIIGSHNLWTQSK